MPEGEIMREQFVNEFISSLSGDFDEDILSVLFKKLTVFVNKYEIKPVETSIAIYTDYLPECYQVYFVTRKIEGMSMKSLELYDLYLKDFFRQINKPIKNITTNDIRVYLYKVQTQRGLSNRSLDSRRTIINAFFEWCCNEEYVDRNPCRTIKKIKYETKERKPLTAIELEQLRNACATARDKAMVEFLYSTGCRVTEIVNINKSDVNFETKEVVLFGKGNKHRTSYLNARAELALKNYLDSRDDNNDALFVSDRHPHNRLKKNAIEKRIGQLGEIAQIERKIFPHLIRHTTATNGLNRGMKVEEVQKMLGHENISTTMIYAKVAENTVKLNHTKCIV